MTTQFIGTSVSDHVASSRSLMRMGLFVSTVRAPTDPYYYADLEIQNAVVGSRYWVAQASDLSNVIESGTVATSSFTISGIAAYANPMLVEIRLRKASGGTKYQAYRGYVYLPSSGAVAYVSQVEDEIA